ncbi:O-antigen ligase family protein [Hydrogenophaga sp.]|uniref:O-antigen ligase family protein n=1 Tax=Hydrogenophaga sp. TaxID=1904254 RepID=UPI00356B0210
MAKKKRSTPPGSNGSAASQTSSGAQGAANPRRAADSAPSGSPSVLQLPTEVLRGDWTVAILALMMFLAPALGVPNELMLQDTLKSIVVSFAALAAGLFFFWNQRNRAQALRWHVLVWLPLLLSVYALGSMAWSHTYLAGVEAIRWFIFTLLVWLGLNTLDRERLPMVAWGIHAGAFVAALWTALQFWADFNFFPQGPNPASTFVNRNFFAEFVVCTLPFSIWLLVRARNSATITLLALTTGFNLVAMFMTGTRSALLALLSLAVVMPVVLWRYRANFAMQRWDAGKRILAVGVLLATVLGLGLIATGNPKLIEENRLEGRGLNALERSFARAKSMTQTEEYTERSFSVRWVMWKATSRIIAQRPLSGVGAGAWEVDIPLYQDAGSQLETDYYVHNEFLQLLAEYGLVGWIFLLGLLAYLVRAAWRTWRLQGSDADNEGALRAVTLAALMAFLIVSNAGFPWRMASTGAMFALALAILAASDARLAQRSWSAASRLPWRPAFSQAGAVVAMVCLALASYITQQAAACESLIVRATKIALLVSQSGDYNNPKWDAQRKEMLQLIKAGTDINPHYRKITPMVADEMAKWGDWTNAVWVWESVLGSRPYVTAIMSNVARGYAQMGQPDKAMAMLERAKQLQPNAPSVRSLEVILLSRNGNEPKAYAMAREDILADRYDYDMVNTGFVLAMRAQDWDLAIKSIELRNKGWPAQKVDGDARLGNAWLAKGDTAKALEYFRSAVAATPPAQRQATLNGIPQNFWSQLP